MTKRKIAVVTGGSSGIGFAIAKKLVAEGLLTYITGRRKEKLDEAAQLLGERCIAVPLDMVDLDEIPDFVQMIANDQGRIDVLVNNAGINMKKPLFEMTDQEFQQILLTNLTSIFAMIREVSRVMIPQQSGSIINISSMAAHYGIPNVVAYSASKSGLEGMSRALAVDLSPLGVRVNCVAPGFIFSPMSSKALDSDPARKNKVLSRTPMGKLGDAADVANAVYFLASDDSGFITGEVIKVDGGNAIGF